MKTLLKADGTIEFTSMVKAGGKNELLSVVYAPETADDDGDFADSEVIKAFAHEYLRDHRNLDIEHNNKTLPASAAYIAESFIIAKGDERFQNWKDYNDEPVGDLTGAWATVIHLEDPTLQKAYQNGELDGVSMFGRAAVEQVDPKAASKRVADNLGKARTTQETKMNEEQLKALFAGFKTDVVALVKSTIAEVLPKPAEQKKEEPKTEELKAPVFKGNATDPKDLEAFEGEMRTYEFQKSIAGGTLTADKIAEMRKSLAEGQPSDAEVGIESTDTPREKSLKRELFNVRKSRNAPERKGEAGDVEVDLVKANQDEGLAIAKIVNERQGTQGMRVVSKG